MHIGSEKKFLSLQEAGQVYDWGFAQVEIGGLVLEDDGETIRNITRAEMVSISNIADEYSASK